MNASDFNIRMAALPEPPAGYAPPAWEHWRHQLWELGQSQDPNTFTDWPCCYHTMLIRHRSVDYLYDRLSSADPRWLNACLAPRDAHSNDVGDPMDFYHDTLYSQNFINQAYHLLQWEQRTGQRVEDMDSIVEWGGGYGAMCAVVHRMGFKGSYTIYDFPEFNLLQEWFLSQLGIDGITFKSGPPKRVTDFSLLIAMYSLSETPLDLRRLALDRLRANSYAMAYTFNWEDFDNFGWFSDWTISKAGFNFVQWPMTAEHGAGYPDMYCVGWKHDSQSLR